MGGGDGKVNLAATGDACAGGRAVSVAGEDHAVLLDERGLLVEEGDFCESRTKLYDTCLWEDLKPRCLLSLDLKHRSFPKAHVLCLGSRGIEGLTERVYRVQDKDLESAGESGASHNEALSRSLS